MKRHEYILILALLGSPAYATDIILQCKTKPYGIKGLSPSEMVDGYYTITNNGSHIKIGESDRLLPLETSPNEYKWAWPIDETKPLVVVESINRVTGNYALTATKNNVSRTIGEGTCQRGELKF